MNTLVFDGHKAKKEFSGNISLRLPPDLHAEMAAKATAEGKSLNQWITETIEDRLDIEGAWNAKKEPGAPVPWEEIKASLE